MVVIITVILVSYEMHICSTTWTIPQGSGDIRNLGYDTT